MNKLRLLTRSFWYFRLTNLAVVLGVAVGVSVLGGSLLVGHSTRQSMVAMVDARLGSTDYVLVAPHVFKSSMAQRVMDQAGVKRNIAYLQPILTTTGSASKMDGSEKFEKVTVFGADSSTMLHLFSWGPSGVVHAPLTENILWVGESLAADLGLTYGSSLKIHLDSDPLRTDSGLWGVSEETGLLIGRNNVLVLHENMPEGLFSLGITQHIPKNVWVWTAQLQQALNLEDVANVLGAVAGRGHREEALTAQLQKALAAAVTLEDYGIRLVEADNGEISIESDQLFLPFPVEKAADSLKGATITKVFSYLATTVSDSVTKKEFPYSMIAGVSHLPDGEIADGKIVLNRWAADDLGATPYDTIVVEFPKRGSDGIIRDGSAEFTLDRIISMDGYGGDRTLVPEFKGLTDVNSISDWKPPRDFRFDSSRIRPTDVVYWNKYKAAPKAFITIGTAKTLWETPYVYTCPRVFERGIRESTPRRNDTREHGALLPPDPRGTTCRRRRKHRLLGSLHRVQLLSYLELGAPCGAA